jgi:hypothetical protein
MGLRGLVGVLLLLSVIVIVPPAAKAVGPSITNVTWTPWVPAFRENVIVEADVSGPQPLNVTASWCILPPFICIPFSMQDTDGDGRYTSPPIYASDLAGSEPATGAHFNVSAVDGLSNYAFTTEIYVVFANTTTVGVTLTPSSAAPSQAIAVTGTAVYQNNSSAPAKFSPVDFRILETGASWSVTSDSTGAFASSFNAPPMVGSYTLRTTVSNRSISGSTDRYLAVATSPTPDLAVVAGSLVMTPGIVVAGGVVTISASVENRGTLAAGAFSVRINVSGPSGGGLTRDLPVSGLAAGARADVSTSWTAAEGSWSVTVIVDPGQQISELSEDNNRAGRGVNVAPSPSNGSSATLMVGLVMVGVGVAAVVAFAYRRRMRRTKLP